MNGPVTLHILLETGRLRLRRFVPADADLLVALDADPEVMRYITYGQPTPRSAYVETYLPRWFAIYQAQPGLGYFAAERRDTGEFLGWFHLRDDRIERAMHEPAAMVETADEVSFEPPLAASVAPPAAAAPTAPAAESNTLPAAAPGAAVHRREAQRP